MRNIKIAFAIFIMVCVVFTLLPTAAHAEDLYIVDFDTLGGSEVGGVSVEDGALVDPPPKPIRDGYEFTGWYKEPNCTSKWRFDTDTVTADMVLYAGWNAVRVDDTVTITAVAGNSDFGKVTGGGDYKTGDSVTLTAVPNEGYRFVKWKGADAKGSRYSFEAKESLTVTAEFVPIGVPVLSVQSAGFDSVVLSWTDVEGAAGYEVYRSTQKSGTYSQIAQVSSTEYKNNKLTAGKTYYYRVRAYCSTEESTTFGSFASASAVPRGVAASASAVPAGIRSIQVAWSSVSGAGGYEVYRSTSKSGTYSKVSTAPSQTLTFTDSGLVTDKVYYYKVRGLCIAGDVVVYADFSDIVSAAPAIAAPVLTIVPSSSTSNRLTWSVQTGIGGYEIYRSTTKSGTYTKIFTAADWPTAVYTNTGLTTNKTYYYKIRAYSISGSTTSYGAWSSIQSATPSTAAAAAYKERSYTIYYQGDPKWGFSSSVSSTACVLTSYAITINNMGISATPRTVYNSNGKRTQMNMTNLRKNFGVKAVCALGSGSEFLYRFDGHKTYVNKPSVNAQKAIKEALNIHPEGVILYFKSGSGAHAIVACKYDGNTIYFSDPGRKKTTLLLFKDTWVSYHHRMTYANLAEMIALDKV